MITPRNIIAVAVLLAIFVFLFAMKGCLDARQKAAQAQYEAKAADAYAGAAKGAVEAVAARSENEAELKEVVATAAKEISDAPGSEQEIPPAAKAAALRAACRLPSYRDAPACRLSDNRLQPAR